MTLASMSSRISNTGTNLRRTKSASSRSLSTLLFGHAEGLVPEPYAGIAEAVAGPLLRAEWWQPNGTRVGLGLRSK